MRVRERLKPAVPRRWLLVLAGVVWAGVGVMLVSRAVGWLERQPMRSALPLAVAGMIFGFAMYRYVFAGIAARNVLRIARAVDRPCVFAFQNARSYAVTALMIALGLALRHSAFPKPYLAVCYAGVGIGLLAASAGYAAGLLRRPARR